MPLGTHRTRVALVLSLAVLAALLAFALAGPQGEVRAQAAPPFPVTYSGTVTVGGATAPDGLTIVARMESPSPIVDDYQSGPRVMQDGRYRHLVVGPTSAVFSGRQITFHILAVEDTITAHLGDEGLVAAEIANFGLGPNPNDNFPLTFPAIPPAPTPTPTHTPVATVAPTNTPTPVPTATPEPTPTPEPTATPEPTPTPEPTATPVPTPTSTPTPAPTPTVTIVTATPTATPAVAPTATPEPDEPGTCGQGSATDAYVLLAGLGLLGLVLARRRRGSRP